MEQIITCINCPVGCRMTVKLDDNGQFLSVSGNTCPRGEKYARQECTLPERMITAVISLQNSRLPLSVKTASPVPKALIHNVMEELSNIRLNAPVKAGAVVVADILNTGVDVIDTRSVTE